MQRVLAQNDCAPLDAAECAGITERLYALIMERGLPPKLAPGDPGVPGGMAEELCAPLVARVMAEVPIESGREGWHALLSDAVKQLVKTCFYPEFTVCRDSYREVGKGGACKRQELSRVRKRVSGTHCIDCPYWQTLDAAAHQKLLADAWCGAKEEFAAHHAIFLPEDFRAVRRWVRAHAPVAV